MSEEPIGRKTKANLVKQLDAAIALLTRARELAVSSAASDGMNHQGAKRISAGMKP